MSRSGYSDDIDNWQLIRWRGQVASAIRGRRGQQLLKDLLAALDTMPDKRLITHELETADGSVCALGALGKARGIDMLNQMDFDDPDGIAMTFDVATPLVREIVYMNDEYGSTPEQRWKSMRAWTAAKIKEMRS